ncbi:MULTISPECIES: DUF485 domain-containing protein [Streptomyces]|jgi:uncharacterized membrane protein (DUF485 family)|uniref:DUF485 domain-containing protein n=1 Tax=Streptomyces doudnae TaxID=3075536 RepID=A0ABD5EW14_9ACTN|nr:MULTISPECIES: DUF485 domain-containing protein [unclassified Streptomyces]MDT0438835.1 DUF485 domain-containing protein [Streptomyces sp. DSM 41981]MYQ66639.1 DUF485 domain-containing protein [Streptomyces sp. SID4950]SCE23262.1 Uncharacterized membrane protein, DUF485 family [Streptomyces sp. SolWspMP-5a-2]
MQSRNGRSRGGGSTESSASPAQQQVGRQRGPIETEGAGYGDPWYDALASGWGELAGTGGPAPLPTPEVVPPRPTPAEQAAAAADIYLEVQRSEAFREVRSRYRRFVVPACAIFFSWYVAYVVAATTAPGLMAVRVVGSVNVAMVAGLGQFFSTFVLAWAYARHARLRRDRAALELRWDTQELTRGLRGGA